MCKDEKCNLTPTSGLGWLPRVCYSNLNLRIFYPQDICWHHKQCPHVSSNLIPAPKTEKLVSAPSTPAKRKPSKTTHSLRAQIKAARDKKSSKNSMIDSTEIDIKIDDPEETTHDKEMTIDVENAENKSAETSIVEEIPKLPRRKKVIRKWGEIKKWIDKNLSTY